jgi:hypothetical protein
MTLNPNSDNKVMRHFGTTKARFFLFFLVMALGALKGCGGGSGTAAKPDPVTPVVESAPNPVTPVEAPAPAPVIVSGMTYTAFGEGRVSSGSLTFDASNSIVLDSITYTLTPTPNLGCTFTSNPLDPDMPVCSQLPGGEAFLLCNGTNEDYFDAVLFKPTVVDADIEDLRGLALSAVTCGTPATKTTNASINFSVSGTSTETRPSSTSMVDSQSVLNYARPTGAREFDFQRRFVTRKLVQSAKTTYFLLDLHENVVGNAQIKSPKIYVTEVDNLSAK